MWTPSEKDLKEIESWGHLEDPFAAVKDFSQLKVERRWLNPLHHKAHAAYHATRGGYIVEDELDEYYKTASKPIDRFRWEYLLKRKAWYIMPLGWDEIAKNGSRIVDVGCGDGDVTQRLIDFIHEYMIVNGIDKNIEVVGVDLNHSRIENARRLVKSPSENIAVTFEQVDVIGDGFDKPDGYFDFALCVGVLEILADNGYNALIKEMCRVTSSGIYVEDLFETFPGGYPRDTHGREFANHKFACTHREVILSEPFDEKILRDPMQIWPVMLDQNIFFQKL